MKTNRQVPQDILDVYTYLVVRDHFPHANLDVTVHDITRVMMFSLQAPKYTTLLSVIIEHVFGVYDGNIEELQISADGGSNGLGVVGLNSFELFHKFFKVLDRIGIVTGRDAPRHWLFRDPKV
jgi:hypothetical protein